MTPQTFIAKWQAAKLSERSACQQHFLDLCELLGQPTPAQIGVHYTSSDDIRTLQEPEWAVARGMPPYSLEFGGRYNMAS